MKRILLLMAVVAGVVFAVRFSQKGKEAQIDETQEKVSAKPFKAPAPPTDGPREPASLPSSAPSSAKSVAAFAREEKRLLAQFSEDLRPRARYVFQELRPGLVRGQLEIDGIFVENSRLRYGLKNDRLSQPVSSLLPQIKSPPPEFPDVNSDDMRAVVESTLSREKAEELSRIEGPQKAWMPHANGTLSPCYVYVVEYVDATQRHRTENWCVNTASGRVETRRSALRH